MNSIRNKIKVFTAKYFILIIILLFGLPYIWYSEGFDAAINILSVLVCLFSPLFVMVILIHIFMGKSTFKDDGLLLLANILFATLFFVFLINNKQRLFFFVFDGILGLFIVLFFFLKYFKVKK